LSGKANVAAHSSLSIKSTGVKKRIGLLIADQGLLVARDIGEVCDCVAAGVSFMRITVPIWEDEVSPVHDTASKLLIIGSETQKEVFRFEAFL